jgi:excisionase family DNA binding protein
MPSKVHIPPVTGSARHCPRIPGFPTSVTIAQGSIISPVQQRTDIDMEPMVISVNEAAVILGIGRTKIYSLIGDGCLSIVKIGRRTLVTTESIRALVASMAA